MSHTGTALQRYYQMHSQLYDATRWSFLFGRRQIVRALRSLHPHAKNILEVGCGTGSNLLLLADEFPDAQLYGCDLSPEMLGKAHKKMGEKNHQIHLIEGAYPFDEGKKKSFPLFDVVLISYVMTMIPESQKEVITSLQKDMSADGSVGVVDFHNTRWSWFARWMQMNHVTFDAQMPERLEKCFSRSFLDKKSAYAGLWQYFVFVGQKR